MLSHKRLDGHGLHEGPEPGFELMMTGRHVDGVRQRRGPERLRVDGDGGSVGGLHPDVPRRRIEVVDVLLRAHSIGIGRR